MTPANEMIRSARQRAGLSQASLASRLGGPQSVVARLERPGSNPTWSTLSAVLEATGHVIEIRKRRSHPAVGLDLGQLRERLALTPAERLRLLQEEQSNIDRLVAVAQRQSDG
jgi:transcriptional regulator with XRE-family HTH domain